jgi:transcriptional regulator with XRE-family HTH domain
MANPNRVNIRSKMIGVLLMDARQYRGKSLQECADTIGVSDVIYESYEFGNTSPSLPELESLAFFLKIPIEHFWGNEVFSEPLPSDQQVDYEKLIKIRQKIIGTLIQKARVEKGLTLESVAELSGISTHMIENYELGEAPLPLPELELLCEILGRPIKSFQDQQTLLSKAPDVIQLTQQIQEMPSELLSFVIKPINRPYLELAQRLSEMSVDKLRAVAEGLLEITL